MTFWALMITDGTTVEFPPELYASSHMAQREARRWASVLSAEGQVETRAPFEGRLEVGFRDIRVVPVDVPESLSHEDSWIGTFWTRDGYPDPEAILLRDRAAAREWCTSPLPGNVNPVHMDETEWTIAAVFLVRGEEEYAVAHLVKVVS